jgi:hypothetical protein
LDRGVGKREKELLKEQEQEAKEKVSRTRSS